MIVERDVSIDLSNKCQTIENKWDTAIKDAGNEIIILTRKRASLQQAIRIFKANKRDGVPWPGTNKKAPNEGG